MTRTGENASSAKNPPTVGVVLAGGRAARMGGGDKPLLEVGGRPILDRVITALTPQCCELILSANGDPARFAPRPLPVVADTVSDHPGPLAGILAGLEWIAEHRPGIKWVLTAPADCPFLPDDLVERLHRARSGETHLAIALSGGQRHPTIGLWHVSLKDALRHALVEEKDRRANGFATRHNAVCVEWPAIPVDPLFNVNTPELLSEAEHLATVLVRSTGNPDK